MNISQETIGKIQKLYSISFHKDGMFEECSPSEATHIDVGFELNDGQLSRQGNYIGRSIKCPKKKEVTLSWLLDKLNKGSQFKSLSDLCSKVVPRSINCYPTSYGIGVFVVFRSEKLLSHISSIEKLLQDNSIEYRNEVSRGRWVYRFVISKSEANISRLQTLAQTTA